MAPMPGIVMRSFVAELCRAAGIAEPDLLADTLSLLLEGARVSRQSVGAEGPSAQFVRMAQAVIASFKARGPIGKTEDAGKERGPDGVQPSALA